MSGDELKLPLVGVVLQLSDFFIPGATSESTHSFSNVCESWGDFVGVYELNRPNKCKDNLSQCTSHFYFPI